MILKLTILLTSYVLTRTPACSYVLFAANIDDFRSLAHKIIPGKLADQIADMAVKNQANYKPKALDKNKALIEETGEYSSDSSDSYYSDDSKDQTRTKDTYKLNNNEDIDLDELVRRVKERLEKEYKLAKQTQVIATQDNQNISIIVNEPSKMDDVTTEAPHSLKDYFYRDDNMNGDFGKVYEEQKLEREGVPSLTMATESPANPYEEIPIYDENIAYVDQNADVPPAYEQDPAINPLGNPSDQNQKYELVTAKDNVQEYVQPEREFDEYGSLIKKNDNSMKVTAKEPQQDFYQEPEQSATVANTLRYDVTEPTISLTEPQDLKLMEGSTTTEESVYYEENLQETADYDTSSTTEGPVDYANLFKEIDMMNPSNDSYEEYVTPERENIFDDYDPTASEKPKVISGDQRFTPSNQVNVVKGILKAVAEPVAIINQPKNNNVVRPPSRPAQGQGKMATPSALLIRAKTASMWYKDPNIANYDESKKRVRENSKRKTSKRPLKTAFPTRQRFSMSSPNYFAKMPVVAEKYNFDEPIPEKDREPENLKPIGNPPAMINKKVKLE